MGPNYDFYGVKIKVNEIGYDSLNVHVNLVTSQTILNSNDYVPNKLCGLAMGYFPFLFTPPAQKYIRKKKL